MTKPSSSPSESAIAPGLFGPMFATAAATTRTDRHAWIQAMLDVERALAAAQARCGVIPRQAAAEIAEHCGAGEYDVNSISLRGAESATPVIALVKDLTEHVDAAATAYVHRGATSQDVVDTAAMLIVRETLDVILDDLHAAARECARLTERHRDTPMVARSLLQQALPTTFGRKCAGWLSALTEATSGLRRVRDERLAVQFGGPAGTLASLGDQGVRVTGALAEELGLAEPDLPWHTDRTRIGELAGALGTVAGALGKIALDVKLQAQTEVGELAEGSSGGSSAMPHKRNPVRAVRVSAATERVPGLIGGLFAAMPQEHERAAGSWQAEWEPLVELLRLVAAAASATREMLADLQVDPERMVTNLDLTGGLLMAESAASALSGFLGRSEAHELVTGLCRQAVAKRTTLRAELLADSSVREVLSEQDVQAATEPADYLGSAGEFVDRALRTHTRLSGGDTE